MTPYKKQFLLSQIAALASAGFGFPGDPRTGSFAAALPFNAGKSNALLLPPLIPLHLPKLLCCVHNSAPTQGCTFHPTSNVTLPVEANRPLKLVIWYFGFEFLKRMTPIFEFSALVFLTGFFLGWASVKKV